MKLLPSLSWALLSLGLDVVLGDASVYIHDHDHIHDRSEVASITPNTARLLFAQRLGLSQYHTLGEESENTIHVLNQFGAQHPSSPFVDDAVSEEQNTDRLLFIIEGVEFPEDLMGPDERMSMSITDPPNAAQNAKLAQDLLEQALHAGSGKTMSHIKHNLSLQGLTRSSGQRYTHAISTLKTILQTYRHQMPLASRTIVLMPPTSQKSKRESISAAPYGTYTTPLSRRHAQSLQQPRQQQQQHESPLEEFTPLSSPSSTPANPLSPLQDVPTTRPLPTLPKICHPSRLSASTDTNNCSSHGSIYLRASGANGNPDCWACRCNSTSITTTDAAGNSQTKTTHWGGAACQKKDVSTQFWLFATVTVVLLAVVGYGIGLLVDIGEGPLPGVLGAGVGGARAGGGGVK